MSEKHSAMFDFVRYKIIQLQVGRKANLCKNPLWFVPFYSLLLAQRSQLWWKTDEP